MVIDRNKHNKYTTDAIYGNQNSGGIVTDQDGNVSGSEGLNYSGGIIYIGGGGGSLSPELIAQLTNQDAFSYLNISDGINTVNVEAKQEKDYINLNILGDNETIETRVSKEKYLPETFLEGTGKKPGRYSVSYNKVVIPDVSGGEPVEVTKWVITIKKVYGNPIFASTDFNGVELLEEGISLGAYSINSDKLTITSDPITGLQQIVMFLDTQFNFTEIRLIMSEDYTTAAYNTIVSIPNIVIQTYTTVLITQAGVTRYWQLDEEGKLFTTYDTYTIKTLGAKDMIWSDKGYTVGNFVSGISGGTFHISDELGTTYAEMDKLKVRKKAYFETLEIVNVNTVGGKQIISPAGAITIRKVEVYNDYYRCYFLGEQDGVEIENRFKVNDLAFSQNFNIKKPGEYEQVANHYFWREVVGVSTEVDADGNHYIDLSIVKCDTDSDIPHVNDVVAQLGNTTDPDRQSAMIFSSVDVESPRLILCHGINTYTLNATNYFDLGVDHSTNQAYMNVYGNTYIGAKDQSTYINYTQSNGLNIKAHISASSTYGGQSFSEVFVTTENLTDSVMAVVGEDLEFLQNQIDGNIESYFYDYSPTLNNYPANTWTTEEDKKRHNGDTFTNIQEYIDDTTTPDAGKSWRWVKNEAEQWGWIIISDSDAVAALKKAGKAQDTADGKRKVFTQKPGVNDDYEVGDLWVNATFTDTTGLLLYNNDLLRANTAKKKGELFAIYHWELASKYTDDTLARDAQAKAEAAQAAADAAGSAANKAQTDINNYKDEIDDIFSDGVITTSERNRLNTLTDTIKTTLYDVQTTYRDVYNNTALDGKPQKTNLKSAYDEFSNSANILLNTVSTVVAKDTISNGDITSVNQAYTNFNTDYTDYIGALGSANLEIMNTLSTTAYTNAVNKFAWLNGLFDPDQATTIEGGVVTTGVLALGKTNNSILTVNAGISGISNDNYVGGGIVIWFGGDMLDKDNYTAGNRPANVATSLFRYDGSGYLGYTPNSDASKDEASIWWDSTGNIHANPLSFFVGEESVGLLLSAFQIHRSPSTGLPVSIIPKAPFTRIPIKGAYIDYDAVNNAVYVYTEDESGKKVACNFYAYGEVSAYGSDSGTGGGGLDVDAMWDILGAEGTEQIHPSHISTALSSYATQSWVTQQIDNIAITSVDWGIITGKPSWIGSSKPTYAFSEITGKPTTLAGYGITDAYTKTQADGRYVKKSGDAMTGVLQFSGALNVKHHKYGISTYAATGSYWEGGYKYFNTAGSAQLGAFGAYGSSNALNYLYIGKSYDDAWLKVTGGDVVPLEVRSTNATGQVIQVCDASGTGAELGWYSGIGAFIQNDRLSSRPTLSLGGVDSLASGLRFRYSGNYYDVWHGGNYLNSKNEIFNNQLSISLVGYDENKWYPCWFPAYTYDGTPTRLVIFSALRGNKPSWGTHQSGISLYLDVECIGGGWGTITGFMNCNHYTANYGGETALGGAEQNSMGSVWLVYLRGGTVYYYWLSNNRKLTTSQSGYSWTSESHSFSRSPKTSQGSPLSGIYKYAITNSNVASATKLQTARSLWGQSFDGTGNVSGSMSGVGTITPLSNNAYTLGTNDVRFSNAFVTSWIYAGAGMYMDGPAVTRNSSYIELSNAGDEMVVSSGAASYIHINYRAPGYSGRKAPSTWYWCAGSSSSWANFNLGSLAANGNISATGLLNAPRIMTAAIRIECDNTGALNSHGNEINNFNSHLYLQHHSGTNLVCCNGGGKVGIGTVSPSYKLHVVGDVYANGGWLRSSGATGWYNDTYSGGWYMTDSTYLRPYNSKIIYSSSGIMAAYSPGSWISMAQRTTCIYADNNNSASSAHALFRTKWNNGNAMCYGGLGDEMGFYAFPKSYIDNSNNAYSWKTVWSSSGTLTHYGNFCATGEVTAYSDIRLKSNIRNFTFRGRLQPKTYVKDNKQAIGFIAQDVQVLYPELVIEGMDEHHFLSLNYGNITAVLSAQINQVEDEVIVLKNKIRVLEEEIITLKRNNHE